MGPLSTAEVRGKPRRAPNVIRGSHQDAAQPWHFVQMDEDFLSLQKQQSTETATTTAMIALTKGNWCFSERYYQQAEQQTTQPRHNIGVQQNREVFHKHIKQSKRKCETNNGVINNNNNNR